MLKMILVLYVIDREFEFLFRSVKVLEVLDILIYVNRVSCLFLFVIGLINFRLFFVFENVILNSEM